MIQKMILAVGAILFLGFSANLIGETSILINLKSGILVLCGTMFIGFLSFPMKNYKDLFRTLHMLFKYKGTDYKAIAKNIEMMSRVNRRYGNLALEDEAIQTNNLFLRKGIELIVDGYDPYEVHTIMEKEYELYFSRKESLVNILKTLQKLAPVIGFVGTIIGLINVLSNMGTPMEMGKGMAIALYTTLYGLLLANFFFLPLYNKLSEHIKTEATLLNVILEGVLDISKERNSKAVAHRLQSYLENYYGAIEYVVESDPRPEWSISFNPLQKLMTRKQNA